jgi:putative copper export protein
MQAYILTLHILAATVWTGGHLILAIAILPQILKKRDVKGLRDFESKYEKIGMPALVIQVVTGIYLAYSLVPDVSSWFSFSDFFSNRVGVKLILLLFTVLFALSAKIFVIPKLSDKNLNLMAFHIISVTIISVLFVIVGSSFKNVIF